MPAYQAGNERAGMPIPLDHYADPARGAIPEWTNEMAELSWLHWLTFDGLSAAGSVSVPSLLIHSDDCVLPGNIRTVYSRLGPADLEWPTGGQLDFYDQPAQVGHAVDAVDANFTRTLGRQA